MRKPLLKQFKARKNYRCDNCGLRIWAKSVYLRISVKVMQPIKVVGPLGEHDAILKFKNSKVCESCSKAQGHWPGANGE